MYVRAGLDDRTDGRNDSEWYDLDDQGQRVSQEPLGHRTGAQSDLHAQDEIHELDLSRLALRVRVALNHHQSQTIPLIPNQRRLRKHKTPSSLTTVV